MKKVFIFLAFIAFLLSPAIFQSCKKCSTCKYTYSIMGYSNTYTYPEQCGKKSDIDAYEQACKDAAALVGGTCTCDSK